MEWNSPVEFYFRGNSFKATKSFVNDFALLSDVVVVVAVVVNFDASTCILRRVLGTSAHWCGGAAGEAHIPIGFWFRADSDEAMPWESAHLDDMIMRARGSFRNPFVRHGLS